MWLNILFVLILATVVIWIFRQWIAPRLGSGSGFKCRTCRHCRKLYDDGVMCGYRDKQTFKNPAQIDMCPDHTPR